MRCPRCIVAGRSPTMVRRGYTHVTKVGGFTVTDSSGKVATCKACGEVSLSSGELSRYEQRAARLILMEGTQVNGAVLRYARKALGLRQKDLAEFLQRNEQQISRDEKAPELRMELRLAVSALLTLAIQGTALEWVGSRIIRKLEILPH